MVARGGEHIDCMIACPVSSHPPPPDALPCPPASALPPLPPHTAEWVTTVRNYPAPWAEVSSDSFVLTLPSSTVRAVDDMHSVATMFDGFMDVAAELFAVRFPVTAGQRGFGRCRLVEHVELMPKRDQSLACDAACRGLQRN